MLYANKYIISFTASPIVGKPGDPGKKETWERMNLGEQVYLTSPDIHKHDNFVAAFTRVFPFGRSFWLPFALPRNDMDDVMGKVVEYSNSGQNSSTPF